MRLIEIKEDFIPKICVIEKASETIVYKASKLSEIYDFVEIEFGKRWVAKNSL